MHNWCITEKKQSELVKNDDEKPIIQEENIASPENVKIIPIS